MLLTASIITSLGYVVSRVVFKISGLRALIASLIISSGLMHIVFFLSYGVYGLGALYGVAYLGYLILSLVILLILTALFSAFKIRKVS